MRWWRRRPGGDTAAPASSSVQVRDDAHRAGAPVGADPHQPWQDMCGATALRLLDLTEQMSRQLDTAMRDQGDPDVLDHLYRLDSLACQARRHAENLQVLAGRSLLDSDRQVTSLADIIQAARGRIVGWPAVTVGPVAHIAVGEYVACDVIRVMTELLDNSVRYSPAGGPVTASGHLVSDGGVLLRVEDAGIGLTEGDLRRFNAFLRDPSSGAVGGVQQGLAVVRTVISAHGIRVFLTPRSPRGTTAQVYIPAGLLCEVPLAAAVGRAVAGVAATDRGWAPVQVAPPAPAAAAVSSHQVPESVGNDAPGSMPTRIPERMRDRQPAPAAPEPPERWAGTGTEDGPLAGIAVFDAATREGASSP